MKRGLLWVYFSYDKRKKLEELYNNFSLQDIAGELGVHLATVYRELKRGADGYVAGRAKKYSGRRVSRAGYSPELAQERMEQSIKRRGKRRVKLGISNEE